MTENIIQIPKTVILEGREFYADTVAGALTDCQVEHDAQFMPELIDTKIFSDKSARVWQTWFLTPSVRATGKTRGGNSVVAYAHIPTYFSDPKNIARAVKEGLRDGAGRLPNEEWQKILDSEDGKRVFVVDHNVLRNSPSGIIKVSKALSHPQTILFVGGEERAEQYLTKHESVYGSNIGIWHSNDLQEDGVAVARPLCAGGDYDYGLFGSGRLDNIGRFLGVRRGAGEASASQNFPSEKKLADIIGEYVASINQAELTKRVHALFQ
jgi:hypothetical protein